jgi:hypothetical protein
MPFRLNDERAKIQWVTYAEMPHQIYQACLAKGTVSNTRYIQEAVCKALAEDLGIPYTSLLSRLPPSKGNAATLFDKDRKAAARGRHHTQEQVR